MNARALKILAATKLLPLLLLLALPAVAQAQFTFTTNDDQITIISGYSGSGGAVTIPTTINGYPVTSIGFAAFFYCTSLTSITIPDSVTSIGSSAFDGCTSLTSATIGTNVTSIGVFAFDDCTKLASFTIPNSVTSIGNYAFYYCTSLTSVTIPASVTSIGDYTFDYCTSLTSITIPSSVTSIGEDAFYYCTSLTSVTIPDSVTNIWSSAFEDCASLAGVYFQGNSPRPTNDLTVFSGDSNGIVYYMPGTTGWGKLFDGLPTKLLNYFTYTTNNGKITITGYTGPGGAVTIPSTINGYPVTSIGSYAFVDSSLTSVTIGTNITSIGVGPFLYCTSLTNITVNPGNASYITVDGILFNKNQTTLIQYPAAKAEASYTIPASVTNIGAYAFYYCASLSSVTIPASVTTIGEYAFLGCSGLTSVTIPASVTSIGEYVFDGCGSLTSITIPASVTNLGSYAFDGCISLTGVYFQGNSPTPTNDLTVFSGDDNGVVYYLQGTTGWGTMFDGLTVMARSNISVVLTTLHSFQVFTNGEKPTAGLVQGSNGDFYGTTAYGGTNGAGTVFKISTNGALTTLYSFSGGNDGANPESGLAQGSDGFFYGTTYFGGASGPGVQGYGTVFKISTNGELATLYSFGTVRQFGNPVDGADPYGRLVQGSDGYFYGTTAYGGPNRFGTVFKISATGSLTSLYSFDYSDGIEPLAGLVQGSDGNFYGTTAYGGTNGNGTVFKISATGAFAKMYSFTGGVDGANPESGLAQGSDGFFYGTTYAGGDIDYNGSDGYGMVFKISATGAFTNLYSFTGGNDGASPETTLVQGSDGFLYGTTSQGGPNYGGTVFKISTNGLLSTLYGFTIEDNFDGQGFSAPHGGLVQGSDGYFHGTAYSLNVGGTVFKISVTGAFTSLYSFTGSVDGASPQAALVQGSGGNFYGTTYGGYSGSDAQTYGTVFKISTNGAFTSLHSFTGLDGGDGGRSKATLVQGSDGYFYGTTIQGTMFNISASGALTNLYTWTNNNDGSAPSAGLVLGSDGYFYGTTLSGGADPTGGTVFKISATGALAWVYSFSGNDGLNPVAALVQGSDGNFYGTTSGGGTNGLGTVFKISASGALTNLYSFTGRNKDGGQPEAGLVEGSDGYFYGTTSFGGTNAGGTVFKISTNGALTYLYSFGSGNDGAAPFAGLVQGSDGYFYGTTSIEGAKNDWSGGAGTVFRISTNGVLTTLYAFTGGNDGGNPVAALVQGSDGSFYGTTRSYGEGGGDNINAQGPGGTVFRLTLGPGPAGGALVVTTTSLPNGTNGIVYSQTLMASGGQTPYKWTNSLGTLPKGLTLPTNGVISGTPMTNGTFNFTVKVTDSLSATATQVLALTIILLDTNKPSVSITNVTAGMQVSNTAFTVKGTATDNVAVASVSSSLNNAAWTLATTANNWTNWSAGLTLLPGTNTVAAYAVDTSGNYSLTSSVSLFYAVTNQLQIRLTGLGKISPNYSNAWLQIGRNYSITSSPAIGFVFTNWIVSTNWLGGTAAVKTNLLFMMSSNLTLQANFLDVMKPTNTIIAPAAGQHMTNALATIVGTAKDNWKVAGVWYSLNSNAWNLVNTTNSYTNWTQTVTLLLGTNTVKAYAMDLGGNLSTTNSLSIVSSNTFMLQLAFTNALPLKTNGLVFSLQLSKGLNGHIQVSSNLTSWSTLTNFVGTNSTITFRDPAATNSSLRYYRAVIP